MYAPFFGLSQEPFSIAPDPHFLYMSEQHREALAHLLYGLEGGGGFVLLTGEIGAGKTTVCRCFMEQVPAATAVAYIYNPKLTVTELLQTICGEFGIAAPADATSLKAHVDALNRFLLQAHAEGRRAVLVIDEAQSLAPDVLEQLRLLTNLETAERKLLQIILIGQPELRDMLAQKGLEQLAQRVIARFHLGALSETETQQYIRHRLTVAGPGKGLPFDSPALARIYRLSGGVPRRINLLADRALLGAYAQGRALADRDTVDKAAGEVFDRREASRRGAWNWSRSALAVASVLMLVIFGLLAVVLQQRRSQEVVMARAWGAASAASSPASTATTEARAAAIAESPAASTVEAPKPSDDTRGLLAAAKRSEGTAWRELALRWQVAIGEGEPCAAVVQARLGCYSAPSGGLQLVRLLARPGLVTLRGADGSDGHAVLIGLDDDSATLQVGAQRFDLSLPALARIWRGDFSTFWRQPPGAGPLDRSPEREREWLSTQLAVAGFDSAKSLRDRISAFQIVQGLNPDGLAGPQTQMRLNRVAGVSEPRLEGLPALTAGGPGPRAEAKGR